MSFLTINQCVTDSDFQGRVNACTAKELNTRGDTRTVYEVANALYWPVASASDVEAAYASALAGGVARPGADEGAVTDGMILANVQAHWPMP